MTLFFDDSPCAPSEELMSVAHFSAFIHLPQSDTEKAIDARQIPVISQGDVLLVDVGRYRKALIAMESKLT